MDERLKALFFSQQFIPHGHCYLWQPELIGLHLLSDTLIALAYFVIPLALIYFVRQRRDIPYAGMFWLFSAFIIACGMTHLLAVWTLWHPDYWLSGGVKAITAIVSLSTAVSLVPLMPELLTIPHPSALQAVNQNLEQTVFECKQIEIELRESKERNQAILATIPDLILLVTAEGTYLEYIPGNATINLLPQDFDPVGRSLTELLPIEIATAHLHDVAQAIATGAVQIREQYLSWQNQLYYEQIRTAPCGDNAAVIVVQNITQRKQVENNLHRYERIVSATPDAISLLDRNYVYQIVNQSYLTWNNKQANEIVGHSVSDLFSQEVFTTTIKPQLDKCLTGKKVQYESWFDYPNLGRQFVSVTYAPYVETDGSISGVVVSARNLTDLKAAEEALQKSEERWQLAIQGTNDGIWDHDLTTNAHFLSPRCLEIVGYDYPEVDSFDKWISFVHPDDLAVLQATWQSHLRQETQYYACEYRMRCKDNSYKWLLARGRVLWNADGKPVRAVGSLTDIQERRQMEEALRQSEQRYRAIVEDQNEFIIRYQSDGTTTFVNEAFCRYFGLSREELLGKCYAPLIYEADQESVQQLVNSMSLTHPTVTIENRVMVNGEARWTQWNNRMLFDQQGYFVEFQAVGRDIMQLKQVEEQLRESERRWRYLLENVRLLVVGLDCTGKIEFVNSYFLELTGYTQAEVIDRNWFKLFLPLHQRSQIQSVFQEVLEQQFHSHYQNSILTKTGEERVIAWNNTQLRNLQGEIIGTMSIGEDITDRFLIERMKTEFISVVSHELRTPLTSIHSALNLLSEGLIAPETERGQRTIQIAADGAERLMRLVNDILDLERLESGKVKLEVKPCNVADLISTARDLMKMMAKQAGVGLSIASLDCPIMVDRDRILQVLTNLLSNAIKFSPEGSSVWLKAEYFEAEQAGQNPAILSTDSPFVCFSVRDQGRGIPNDKLLSIFERFHQVDASDSRQKGGTGLGLAICRSIVQQHSGEIWVESTLGAGSCFYFTLPIMGKQNDDS
jgi:PAS domain S-box-containing protein